MREKEREEGKKDTKKRRESGRKEKDKKRKTPREERKGERERLNGMIFEKVTLQLTVKSQTIEETRNVEKLH